MPLLTVLLEPQPVYGHLNGLPLAIDITSAIPAGDLDYINLWHYRQVTTRNTNRRFGYRDEGTARFLWVTCPNPGVVQSLGSILVAWARKTQQLNSSTSIRSRMRLENLFFRMNMYELLDSLLADFVLAFAFFTSMTYAVLGKRFEKQRPAITMSAAIGFALSIGLVWWERANDLSIKDLGPIAVGFAVLLLAFVMYQSVRQVGGSWAGAGITIGAAIIIARLLGLNIPVDWQIVQTIIVVALIFRLLAFMSHRHSLFLQTADPR